MNVLVHLYKLNLQAKWYKHTKTKLEERYGMSRIITVHHLEKGVFKCMAIDDDRLLTCLCYDKWESEHQVDQSF